jgi:hypothetical protein
MNKLIVKTMMIVLALQGLFLVSPSAVQAHEECPAPLTVEIDVKPVGDVNKINLSSRGVIPVAVLSTETFDARLFTPEMAHLSDARTAMGCTGAEAVRWTYADVNGDGRLDLVFFFRVQELDLSSSTTAVTLMAHGAYDSTTLHIEGTDTVIVKS